MLLSSLGPKEPRRRFIEPLRRGPVEAHLANCRRIVATAKAQEPINPCAEKPLHVSDQR